MLGVGWGAEVGWGGGIDTLTAALEWIGQTNDAHADRVQSGDGSGALGSGTTRKHSHNTLAGIVCKPAAGRLCRQIAITARRVCVPAGCDECLFHHHRMA